MNKVPKKHTGLLVGFVTTILGFINAREIVSLSIVQAMEPGVFAVSLIFGPPTVGYIFDRLYLYPKYNEYINNKQSTYNKILKNYKEKYMIPDNAKELVCINADSIDTKLNNKKVYVWIDDNNLVFANKWEVDNSISETESENINSIVEDLGKYSIELNRIAFFARQGDFYTKTHINGGGSSIGGAAVGAVVGGQVGAIVGSRKEIQSKTEIVDKRETLIKIKDSSMDKYVYFDSKSYETLLRLIPQKEFNFVHKEDSDNAYDMLKKLAELKDKNIITESEFEEKKKELLQKIK